MSLKELERRIDTLEITQTIGSQAGSVQNPEWLAEYENKLKQETGRDSTDMSIEEILGTQAYREYEERAFHELIRQESKL